MEPKDDSLNKQNNRLTFFKYNAVLSIVFFLMSTFYLGSQTKDFDFSRYTISQMTYFLSKDKLSFFNLLFFIKCFLDLSFTYYVFKFFNLRLKTIPATIWLIAVLSFGLLGFFPASQFTFIHQVVFLITFFSWTFSQYTMAKLTQDERFVNFSKTLILIESVIANIFLFLNYFNAISETAYFILIFFWLIIFIGKYLR